MANQRLKVYGWQGWGWGMKAIRCIVAASSKAKAAEAAGERSPRRMFSLCETGNKNEIAVATAEPYVVFRQCLDNFSRGGAWERVTTQDPREPGRKEDA